MSWRKINVTYSVEWNTSNGFDQPLVNYITPFWIGKCSSMYYCKMAVPTLCPVFTIHRLNIILKSSFLHFSVLVCAPSTDHRRFARHLLCCPSYQRSCQGEICFQTKDLMYDTRPVLRYQIKVHTRVIDAKLNKEYSFTVNSTLEYICQYSYKQDRTNPYRFDINHLYTKYKILNLTAHTLTSSSKLTYMYSSVELHKHSNALVDLLPPEADSSISMLGADEKPSVSYADIGEMDMQKQEMREAVRSH
ncbi:hypothetical protein OUZ56_028914 [Daphnia magna]|uniref:Uncharacterized protein n=1 Tax=Daphnia magna TaxID=35525 RepID=A0ABR0B5C6_9CRUS|nr:hypothetical protein OUZ56_028914 [Daphnia magna]